MRIVHRWLAAFAAFALLCAPMQTALASKTAKPTSAPTATPLPKPTSTNTLKVTPNPSPLPYNKETDVESLRPEQLIGASAILVDADTGRVLFRKDETRRMIPASTTKVMTALLALEHGDLRDQVTAPAEVVQLEPTLYGLKPGEHLSLNDALHGLMMASYNDVALSIAVHIAGDMPSFAKMMNDKAKELGCKDTNFVTPHGLPNVKHYTTVTDMSIIAREAMKNPTFREIVATSTYPMPAIAIYPEGFIAHNRNLMLPSSGSKYAYPYSIGIKTGFTNDSQHTYVGAATKDGMTLIAVVFGTTNTGKWMDSTKLFDYGFTACRSMDIQPIITSQNYSVDVRNAAKDDALGGKLALIPSPAVDPKTLTLQDTKKNLDAFAADPLNHLKFSLARSDIEAPIQKGEELATLTVLYPDSEPMSIPLVADRDVRAQTNLLSALNAPGNVDPNAIGQTVSNAAELPSDNSNSIAIIAAIVAGLLVVGFACALIFRPKKKRRSVGQQYYANHYGSNLPPRNNRS